MKHLPLITAAILAATLALPAHAGGKKPAQTTTRQSETTNSIGITMVTIPSGKFIMGSCQQNDKEAILGQSRCLNPDRDARSEETPQHQVSVNAFQMGKTEVTLGQFKRFIKATGNAQLISNSCLVPPLNG